MVACPDLTRPTGLDGVFPDLGPQPNFQGAHEVGESFGRPLAIYQEIRQVEQAAGHNPCSFPSLWNPLTGDQLRR